ncbi:MAG TPA: ester cyclase [Streptosporangiaceae bacterium]|nr:ester cyclase [Streptosporangiaceae bacterium]
MSDLERLLRVHYDGVNSGDLDVALSVFDPDCEIVTPNGPARGAQAQRALGEAFATAAPDNHLEALRTFEAGDTIIVEGVYTGTHTGPLAGPGGTIPASGRRFSLPFVDILQARDGRFVSHRIYWDNATFLAQLGVMPEPAAH